MSRTAVRGPAPQIPTQNISWKGADGKLGSSHFPKINFGFYKLESNALFDVILPFSQNHCTLKEKFLIEDRNKRLSLN